MVSYIQFVLSLAYTLVAIIVIFGIFSIESPKLTRAAFYFGIVVVTLGEIYLLLGAEFLGVIQILAYGGGIAILIVFALMFIPRTEREEEVPYSHYIRAPIAVALALMFAISVGYVSGATEGKPIEASAIANILLSNYFLVVILVVVLLIITMVISAYLAMEER